MLWKMIEHEKTLPKFTPEGAVASMLYDRMRGRDLSQREYGKIWNWTRGSVRHKWAEIDAICTVLELKSQQPNVSPENGPNDTKNALLQPRVSPQLYNTITLSNIKPINNLKPSTIDKPATERIFESYDEVFDSWNEIAEELHLPPVRQRTDKRKKKIKSLAPKLWPIIGEVYDEMRSASNWFLKDHRPGFDWVWNETNFTKIYEGNYRAKNTGKSKYSTKQNHEPVRESAGGKWGGLVARDTDPGDAARESLDGSHEPRRNFPPAQTGTHG